MSLLSNFQDIKDKIKVAYNWTNKILHCLPEYTPIEYIQVSGTQWIDVGLTGSTNIKFEARYMETSNQKSWKCLIGSRTSSTSGHVSYYYSTNNSNTNTVMMGTAGNQTIYAPTKNFTNIIVDVTFDGTKLTITDGSVTNTFTHTYTTTTTSNSYNLHLFNMNQKNSNIDIANDVRLYSFKLTRNGVLARNFIPVKDIYDVPCLYDTINSKFYYNQGTGDFIAGPELT